MQIVAMDGVYTVPTTAKTIFVAAAQRYDVLVTAKKSAKRNFDIAALVDMAMLRTSFSGNQVAHASLVYSSKYPKASQRDAATLNSNILPAIDDLTVEPLDGQKVLGPVTKQVTFDTGFQKINGINRAVVNNITFLAQKYVFYWLSHCMMLTTCRVPTLYTALSAPGKLKSNSEIYGVNSNSFVLEKNDIVELVINNFDDRGHPWHVHGHQFQVVARSANDAVLKGQLYDPSSVSRSLVPARRDTVGVNGGGWVVIRFRADNPGVQLVHCHIEWHMEAGLAATFVEDPDDINVIIPPDHRLACAIDGMKTVGNAAGNVIDFLDLSGAITEPPEVNVGALVIEEH
jgi:iron transport multicopper oxidase